MTRRRLRLWKEGRRFGSIFFLRPSKYPGFLFSFQFCLIDRPPFFWVVLFFFFKHFRGPLFFHRRFLHFAFFLRPAFLLFKLFSEVVATSFPLFALGFFFFFLQIVFVHLAMLTVNLALPTAPRNVINAMP